MTKQQRMSVLNMYDPIINQKGQQKLKFNAKLFVTDRLSESDVLNLKFLFDKFDTDKSEMLKPSEFALLMNALGYKIDKETNAVLRSKVDDQNKCGTLTFVDFIKMFQKDLLREEEKKLKNTFKMFLTKGEQQITWEGLYNRSKLLGEIPDEKLCKTIIKTYDSDGDGKLSFEDFKMVMQFKKYP